MWECCLGDVVIHITPCDDFVTEIEGCNDALS